MYSYEVGKIYSQFCSDKDQMRVGIEDTTIVFVCNIVNPSFEDIRMFDSSSPMTMTAGKFDDLLILTISVVDFSFDATYNPNLTPQAKLNPPTSNAGYTAIVYLFDEIGRLLHIRVASLPVSVSNTIYSIVQKISASRFTVSKYAQMLNTYYNVCDIEKAISSAIVSYKFGTQDDTITPSVKPATSYPGSIPDEIAHLYEYVPYAGHSILAVPEFYEKDAYSQKTHI